MRAFSQESTEHCPKYLINLQGNLIHFEHSFVGFFSLLILKKKADFFRPSLGAAPACQPAWLLSHQVSGHYAGVMVADRRCAGALLLPGGGQPVIAAQERSLFTPKERRGAQAGGVYSSLLSLGVVCCFLLPLAQSHLEEKIGINSTRRISPPKGASLREEPSP